MLLVFCFDLPAHAARVGLFDRIILQLFFVNKPVLLVADQKLQINGVRRVQLRVKDLGDDTAKAGEPNPGWIADCGAEEGFATGRTHRRGAGAAEGLAGLYRRGGGHQT